MEFSFPYRCPKCTSDGVIKVYLGVIFKSDWVLHCLNCGKRWKE